MLRRENNIQANEKNMKQQAMGNIQQQYGLSAQDMAVANQGHKMSDAQKKALADKMLQNSIMDIETKFGKQFDEIEKDPQRIVLEKQIRKLERERDSLIGQDSGNRIESLTRKIKGMKKAYCSQYSPKKFGIISHYIDYTKASLPACYRLEVIENKLTKAQTGADIDIQPGSFGLGKVDNMFDVMSKVFEYNLMTAFNEDPLVGN